MEKDTEKEEELKLLQDEPLAMETVTLEPEAGSGASTSAGEPTENRNAESVHGDDPSAPDEEEEEETLTPEEQADVVMSILQPVSLTMILVVAAVKSITIPPSQQGLFVMVYNEEQSDSTGTKLLGSLLNALLFVAMMIVVTVVFVFLYKYRCLKIIYGWLMGSSGMLLGLFGGYLFYLILEANNWPFDWISFSLILWNFVVVGVIAIFYHAPDKVNQGYLILVSAFLAIFFTQLPEWTTWAILAVIAIYDIFAVLCPRGPLRVLVETAQERQEPIPALLYNGSVFFLMADAERDPEANRLPPPPTREQQPFPSAEERDKKGVKLGLGDFVFYSVLIGRAAMYDMISVFVCFIAIITGLFSTLVLLAIARKALPALPISIFLGIMFFLLSKLVLVPYVNTLNSQAIFV